MCFVSKRSEFEMRITVGKRSRCASCLENCPGSRPGQASDSRCVRVHLLGLKAATCDSKLVHGCPSMLGLKFGSNSVVQFGDGLTGVAHKRRRLPSARFVSCPTNKCQTMSRTAPRSTVSKPCYGSLSMWSSIELSPSFSYMVRSRKDCLSKAV